MIFQFTFIHQNADWIITSFFWTGSAQEEMIHAKTSYFELPCWKRQNHTANENQVSEWYVFGMFHSLSGLLFDNFLRFVFQTTTKSSGLKILPMNQPVFSWAVLTQHDLERNWMSKIYKRCCFSFSLVLGGQSQFWWALRHFVLNCTLGCSCRHTVVTSGQKILLWSP